MLQLMLQVSSLNQNCFCWDGGIISARIYTGTLTSVCFVEQDEVL